MSTSVLVSDDQMQYPQYQSHQELYCLVSCNPTPPPKKRGRGKEKKRKKKKKKRKRKH